MKKLFILLSIFVSSTVMAQNEGARTLSLIIEAQKAADDSTRTVLANEAADIFEQALSTGDDISKQLDGRTISALSSPLGNFTIYSWGIQFADGHYQYYGFAQVMSEYGGAVVTRFADTSDETSDPQNASMQPDNWYGAIYYELVQLGGKKSNVYALVGWDGGDLFLNRKVLEQVRVKSDGSIYFGGYFTDEHNQKHERLIFEYTEKAVMCLRFEPKYKMFVADHLSSPPNSTFAGNAQVMGPDGSFDGYQYVKGEWLYVKDIDFKGSRF